MCGLWQDKLCCDYSITEWACLCAGKSKYSSHEVCVLCNVVVCQVHVCSLLRLM